MRQPIRRALALHALALALAACGGAPAAGTGPTAPPAAAPAATLAPTAPPGATVVPASATAAPPSATAAPAMGAGARGGGTAAALGVTLIPAAEPSPAPLRVTPAAPPPATFPPASGLAGVPHIQQAIADLAARLGIDPGAIKVLRAEEVDWPDGSLGCPRDDMSYTQAIVNGVFVQLEAGGQTYNYHGRAGDAPFLCTSKRGITPDVLPPELRGGGGADT